MRRQAGAGAESSPTADAGSCFYSDILQYNRLRAMTLCDFAQLICQIANSARLGPFLPRQPLSGERLRSGDKPAAERAGRDAANRREEAGEVRKLRKAALLGN